MVLTHASTKHIYEWLSEIPDPEVPALTIMDLGIIRKVEVINDEEVEVIITPTYSGCPAMDVLSMQIRMILMGRGYKKVNIKLQLSPAWTTEWMSEEGKEKLKKYGIAPPISKASSDNNSLFEEPIIPCPKCDATHTELISQFGSTSCKAMYRCKSCLEPFEYFKCH